MNIQGTQSGRFSSKHSNISDPPQAGRCDEVILKERTMYQHAYDKWVWIADNWNRNISEIENHRYLEKEVPQILQYCSGCSFCEEFTGTFCIHCPLYQKYGIDCRTTGNPFVEWARKGHYREPAEELRDAIFELAKDVGYVLT